MHRTFKSQLSFVLLWSALVIVGTLAGFSISYLLARYLDDRDYAFTRFLLVFVVGLLIGLGQWAAIMIKSRNVWWWIPATAIGYSGGSFGSYFILALIGQVVFGVAIPYPERYQWLQTMMGLMFTGMFAGMLQWFALGRKVSTSIRWLFVSGLGLVVGFQPIFYPVDIYVADQRSVSILVMAVGLMVFALLTGTFAAHFIVSPETGNN